MELKGHFVVNHIGLGDPEFTIAVYIANRPNISEYQQLDSVLPLVQGEIHTLGQNCGNGWRKVFNVYAKLLFALPENYVHCGEMTSTWQQYRDDYLLQQHSQVALLFSAPDLNYSRNVLRIICGRTYAKALINQQQLNVQLIWLDNEFAIDRQNRVIVCPYFDYRQLSNLKIIRLVELIKILIPSPLSYFSPGEH